MTDERSMSLDEAAGYMGISATKLGRLLRAGKIRAVYVNHPDGGWLVRKRDVDDFVKRLGFRIVTEEELAQRPPPDPVTKQALEDEFHRLINGVSRRRNATSSAAPLEGNQDVEGRGVTEAMDAQDEIDVLEAQRRRLEGHTRPQP